MSEPTTITLRSYYPYPFLVDGDEGECVIPLRIKRFSVDEGKTFKAQRDRILNPASLREIYRKPEGDEQEKVEKPVGKTTVEMFVVADEEIQRRRVSEMTDDKRAWFDRQSAQDAADEYDFLVRAVTQYLTVDPTARVLFHTETGESISLTSGADLVRAFGGHVQQLHRLVTAIWAENTLRPIEKKTWRWLSDSRLSSAAPAPAAAGKRPDATVAPAASGASAAPAAATASHAASPSGSTPTSRSRRARSSSSRRSSTKSSAGSAAPMTSSSALGSPAGV